MPGIDDGCNPHPEFGGVFRQRLHDVGVLAPLLSPVLSLQQIPEELVVTEDEDMPQPLDAQHDMFPLFLQVLNLIIQQCQVWSCSVACFICCLM